ncbi:MAG: hypothetical protein MZV70_64270 [Desulfobacterales bacterium]|nr:hypothetical protein [Desulfobacterales bacterium]
MVERSEHKGAGHRGRLRERFLTGGLDGFLDYEVIELLLTLGTPRKDCKEAAKAALTAVQDTPGRPRGRPRASCRRSRASVRKTRSASSWSRRFAERYLAKKVVGRDAVANSGISSHYLNSIHPGQDA